MAHARFSTYPHQRAQFRALVPSPPGPFVVYARDFAEDNCSSYDTGRWRPLALAAKCHLH